MNILYSPHKIQKFREMHNRHLNWAISSLIIKNEQHTIMMRKKLLLLIIIQKTKRM
jgi:hypothetical protein